MHGRTWVLALALVAAATMGHAAEPTNPKWPQKWNYIRTALNKDENTDTLIDLLKQSKEAGCTHIALAEWGTGRLEALKNPDYLKRVEKVRAAAKELKLEIVPMVFPLGYGGSTLGYDGNLMAGIPVRDMPFVVKGAKAEPDPAAVPTVLDPGFEDFKDNTFTQWGGQKFPGVTTFVDTVVVHRGKASLRFGNMVNSGVKGASSGLATQKIEVKPFQYYNLSMWLRTDGFAVNHGALAVTARSGKRALTYWNLGVPKSAYEKKEWVKFTVPFNTLDNKEVEIEIGAKWGRAGTLWVDDVEIVPAGLLNVLRRDTAPLTVTSDDGNTIYVEGKDFKPVVDPFIADFPNTGEMDSAHQGPLIERTADSRIRDGQRLRVSFYHGYQIDADQHVVTMQDPKVLEIWDQVMTRLVEIWPSSGYFMSGYDEIRLGCWEPQPKGENLTPGQILARHTTAAYNIIKKHAPQATVYTWSDMYAPYHNGRSGDNYWMVNGNYDKSWEGIPRDMVIMNWYANKLEDVQFFSSLGCHQVLCGYYDQGTSEGVKKNLGTWFKVSAGVSGIDGMMYTTWGNRYKFMKEFFQLVDSYPTWVEAPAK